MKTLVGVDLAENYAPALAMCSELEFPNQEFVFLNAVELLPTYAPPMGAGALNTVNWMTHLKAAGQEVVARAEERARQASIRSTSQVIVGSPADTLITLAEDENADLIVVGSAQRTGLSRFFTGSVGRALAIGSRRSVLATKAAGTPKRPLRALFATDHSEYANRAMAKLIEWAPKGIDRIDVLSAYEVHEGYVLAIPEAIVESGVTLEAIVQQEVRRLTDEAVATLSKAGFQTEARVVRGIPNAVIADQMKVAEADILIMGAQGHGFLARLLVGSTALHQMVNEPYPVLIIRP